MYIFFYKYNFTVIPYSFSFVLVWRVGIHTVIYQYNIVQNAGQQLGKPDEQQPLV